MSCPAQEGSNGEGTSCGGGGGGMGRRVRPRSGLGGAGTLPGDPGIGGKNLIYNDKIPYS